MNDDNQKINEVFKNAGIGDRIWLFFIENKKTILRLLTIIACVFLLWGAKKLLCNLQTKSAKKSYLQIKTISDKEKFIKKYKFSKLAGLTSLSLADDYMQGKNYKSAEQEYKRSYKLLRRTFLAPRALISQAIATYKNGNLSAAEELLNSVIHKQTFDTTFRGQAGIVLIEMLTEAGEKEKAQAITEKLKEFDLITVHFNTPNE